MEPIQIDVDNLEDFSSDPYWIIIIHGNAENKEMLQPDSTAIHQKYSSDTQKQMFCVFIRCIYLTWSEASGVNIIAFQCSLVTKQ